MQQKKNIAPLVCGIIATIFGLVGGFLWVACSDCAYYGLPLDTIWLLLFILFGLVGPVLGLIGSILAFAYKRVGGVLLLFALLFCIGHIVATIAFMAELGLGFSFWLEVFTIFSLILFLVATCFGFRKAPADQPQVAPPAVSPAYYGQYGQPQYGQPQYGQPQYGQPQYGQPQYGQPQYGQPQYGQPQYGQPQYGQPQSPVQKPVQQPAQPAQQQTAQQQPAQQQTAQQQPAQQQTAQQQPAQNSSQQAWYIQKPNDPNDPPAQT